ncbi:hypothetical protein CD153_12195, partial [Staphylococcus carnosus]
VPKGKDGKSITITNTENLPNGDVKVTFSDGHEIVVPKGDKGADGQSISITSSVVQPDGNTKVVFSDGHEIVV